MQNLRERRVETTGTWRYVNGWRCNHAFKSRKLDKCSPFRLVKAGGSEAASGPGGGGASGLRETQGGPGGQTRGSRGEDSQEVTTTTERTDAGGQAVVPGAERISDRALAERRGAEPLRARPASDAAIDVPGTEVLGADGVYRGATRSAREIVADHQADQLFLEKLDTICQLKGGNR